MFVTERVLVESERERAHVLLLQAVLELLQLLDEGSFDFEFRSARVEEFESLDHRPPVLAHQIASED